MSHPLQRARFSPILYEHICIYSKATSIFFYSWRKCKIIVLSTPIYVPSLYSPFLPNSVSWFDDLECSLCLICQISFRLAEIMVASCKQTVNAQQITSYRSCQEVKGTMSQYYRRQRSTRAKMPSEPIHTKFFFCLRLLQDNLTKLFEKE